MEVSPRHGYSSLLRVVQSDILSELRVRRQIPEDLGSPLAENSRSALGWRSTPPLERAVASTERWLPKTDVADDLKQQNGPVTGIECRTDHDGQPTAGAPALGTERP